MRYTYYTRGTCSSAIEFDIEGDVVKNVVFMGGCDGNLKAISKLCDGMTVDKIVSTLKGNKCGWKSTSCADQFAIAVEQAYQKSKR